LNLSIPLDCRIEADFAASSHDNQLDIAFVLPSEYHITTAALLFFPSIVE